MNYELAKQLKDAGFPQTNKNEGALWYLDKTSKVLCIGSGYECDCPLTSFTIQEKDNLYKNVDFVYVPTLPELISECIRSCPCFKLRLSKGIWYADFDDDFRREGISPEEAVINLYLKLHEKTT